MVKLRPLEYNDLSFLLEVRNDPSTRKFLENNSVFSLEECQNWFTTTNPIWYIIEDDTNPVGYIRTNGTDVGCDIHPTHRRKGYARMAYKEYLKDKKYSTLWVFVDNFAKKLYESLGFKYNGIEKIVRGKLYVQMVYNKDKALYIHIPKTGGISMKQNLNIKNNYEHHYSKSIKKILGEDKYNEYYSFTVCRNTWERFHSIWKHRQFGTTHVKKEFGFNFDDFNKYVKHVYQKKLYIESSFKKGVGIPLWCQSQLNWVMDEDGHVNVNRIYQYNEIDVIPQQVNFIFDGTFKENKFPKKNISLNNINYRDMYDSESVDIIYEMYQKEIEFFKYEY